jgi:hypothetical protein
MGILKKSTGGGNTTFVDFKGKKGVFQLTTGRGETRTTEDFTTIDYAYLRKMTYKADTFEGQPVHKAQVFLEGKDDGSKVCMTFQLGTFVGDRILGLLNAAADTPEVPVRFNTGFTKAGDVMLSGDVATKDFVWIGARQDGAAETLKPKYDTPDGQLPKAKEVKINGKVLLNRDEIDPIVEKLFGDIVGKLKAHGQQQGHVPVPADEDEAEATDMDADVPEPAGYESHRGG